MRRGRETLRIAELRRSLALRLPAPMAAPETQQLRRLRLSLVGLLACEAALTLALAPLLVIIGTAVTLLWLAIALAIIGIGILWLRAKWRADEAWLDRNQEE